MRSRRLKLGLIAAGAVAAASPLMASAANADPAPQQGDIVGVGSDTVQYAMDFAADGDFLGNTGFNAGPQTYRIVNFDATPDANARLAYGPDGAIGDTGTATTPAGACSPGDSGNSGLNTTDGGSLPCVLNPTIVLQAGTQPVQRPNGSGAGAAAGALDVNHLISYVRASSGKASTLNGGTDGAWDSLTLGTDNLQMLETTTPVSNAVPLSRDQLHAIYDCDASQLPNTTGFTGPVTWNELTGVAGGDAIVPIVPQVGSGTRTTFLGDISVTTPGSCVKVGEENDPYALSAQGTLAKDAIEPMSGGRLNLFQGVSGFGATIGSGYFLDPSIAALNTAGTLNPAVQYITGVPNSATAGNDTAQHGALYQDTRNLYVYFRANDLGTYPAAGSAGTITSVTANKGSGTGTQTFSVNVSPDEPGSPLDFVRAIFYNPCTGSTSCTNHTVDGNSIGFGTGGEPFLATTAGQTLIASAGITPAYTIAAPATT